MARVLTIILLFLVCRVSAQDRDMIIWNKNQITVHPVKNISLEVSEKLQYSANVGDINSKYAEIYVGHKIVKWLEYGGGYRRTSSYVTSNYWVNENRAMLYFDLREPVHNFAFTFSNRFEYRSFKILEDHFRYRQSLKIDFPALANWGMRFYVSEESFYKFNTDKTHLARLYAGLTILKKEHMNLSTYYSLQKSKRILNWSTSDIVGLNLGFSI